ncbi:hypothetical protein [Streptomyces durocortorensis]|uniref:Response regulatory domain-containing protein n=1 Tax=Streptomyces durocortorensis TaxID=2811104 RepID=A0ABS2HU30_9ACTN|nr:hypothetical protein [Streptomyces durocortorensis]MBM7052983.1 hypothetical protein [Streptomyces durocortorensis]
MIQAVLATDDATFHGMIRATLRATGQVAVAPWHSPDLLLPCVAAHRPDVILLDARSGRAEPLRNQLYVLRESALHRAFAVFAGATGRQLVRAVALVAGTVRASLPSPASCENPVRQS